MSLKLYFRPSFDRCCKAMGAKQIQVVGLILKALEVYYATGCNIEEARKVAPRFFYKQLRKPFYEAGVEANTRVVVSKEDEKCIASFAGNHDQIKRFLVAN